MRSARYSVVVLLLSITAQAGDWPGWRGPGANGVSDDAGPVAWGEGENLAWVVDVPGEGWSTPIVAAGRVIVTAAVPSGGGGMEDVYRFEVRAHDLASGELLWERVALESKPRAPTHRTNTYASETPVTDGKNIFASFGPHGLYCYTLEGEPVWQKDLGVWPMANDWGTASGLAIHDGLLFVQNDNEQESHLLALDAATGERRWRVERPGEVSNWSTPIVWRNSKRTELVLGGKTVRSYDPGTGEELWSMAIGGRSSASPTAVGDALYVGSENRSRRGGTPGGLFAVAAGAEGEIDVTADPADQPGLLWADLRGAIGMASLLEYEGRLYVLERRGGLMRVHDAATGDQLFRQRATGGAPFWSSPWAYAGRVFCLDDAGTTHVVKPGDDYEPLGENRLPGQFWSTPAMADGALLLRSTEKLYCVRERN